MDEIFIVYPFAGTEHGKGKQMKMIALGDYYVWYCDWCDSRNQTLWTSVEKGKAICGVCHSPFAIAEFPMGEQNCHAL
jgi:hypothetical protein